MNSVALIMGSVVLLLPFHYYINGMQTQSTLHYKSTFVHLMQFLDCVI